MSSYLSIWTRSNSTHEIDKHEEQLDEIITNSFLRASLQDEYNRIKDFRHHLRPSDTKTKAAIEKLLN